MQPGLAQHFLFAFAMARPLPEQFRCGALSSLHLS